MKPMLLDMRLPAVDRHCPSLLLALGVIATFFFGAATARSAALGEAWSAMLVPSHFGFYDNAVTNTACTDVN